MKHSWLVLLVAILLFNCSSGTKTSNISQFIPADAQVVIKTNNIDGLNSNLKNNDFLKKLSDLESYTSLEKKLAPLVLLHTENEIVISFSKMSSDSLEYTLATRYHDSVLYFSNETNYKSESLTFDSKVIEKTSFEDQTIYSTVHDSFFVASSSLEKIKKLPYSKKIETQGKELIKTGSKEASFSIFINKDTFYNKPIFLLDSLQISDFTDYMFLDAVVSQDNIQLNGITKAKDSTRSLINIFKDNQPQQNQMAQITPSNADGFISFTFENFTILQENLDKYRIEHNLAIPDSSFTEETLFGNMIEAGMVLEGTRHAIVLNSLDEMVSKDALLAYQNVKETYRDIDILSFEKPELFKTAFYPLVTFDDFNLYCVIDNFFIFSNSIETLQNIIASYQNSTTIASTKSFQELKEQLSDASSLLMVFDNSKFSKILDPEASLDLKYYKATAVQFVYDQHFAHTNMVIHKSRARADANTVSEVFNIKLDADLLLPPQFVVNHTNNQKDIVVQDINNNLYLISNKGEVLWKKKLEGPVLGKIEQVDIYKNGRLQLAFATPNRVYILDRNGKDVSPFPLKFNDAITQPLAIFDYENKRDYRLLVTQGSHVLMYDLNGKTVKGFGFQTASSAVVTQPKHFKLGSKDYIVIKTQEKLYILSRRGSPRVTPKTTTEYSNESVYVYQGNFTTTTKNGSLISIDERGNVSIQQLNLNEQHHIDATSKTLATLTDNKLTIKSHEVELNFGIYTEPKIFYINDKIYVTVTDKQTNKVYLFDSLGKSIANFPVYGSSAIGMANADSDRNPEIVVKSGTDEILLYKIN